MHWTPIYTAFYEITHANIYFNGVILIPPPHLKWWRADDELDAVHGLFHCLDLLPVPASRLKVAVYVDRINVCHVEHADDA